MLVFMLQVHFLQTFPLRKTILALRSVEMLSAQNVLNFLK